MKREDKILVDIANASRLIAEFIAGMQQADFEQDVKTQSAVLHQVTIIGEAVKLLPEEWRSQHTAIPWSQIGRMRDRLIHNYFNVDLNVVWHTATEDVPALLQYIAPLVSPLLAEDQNP